MSKKWNDPDARDNYALLITLDNTIISFIFMYVNYAHFNTIHTIFQLHI